MPVSLVIIETEKKDDKIITNTDRTWKFKQFFETAMLKPLQL